MPTKKEQIEQITCDLEQGIRDVFSSGRFASYLKTMSRFHRYSVNNTILIHLQKPDATLLQGYRGWQDKFNRYVRRGEKGIQILAPSPYTKTVLMDETDENRLPVFDADGNQAQADRHNDGTGDNRRKEFPERFDQEPEADLEHAADQACA